MNALLRTLDRDIFGNMDRFFDDRFNIKPLAKYPPHNLIKVNEDQYVIEVAVAGFDENDINVNVLKDIVTISGKHSEQETEPVYLHKGIATREFELSYRLGNNVEVSNAEIRNGILKIKLVVRIPEEMLPKKIEIKTSN